MLPLIQQYVDSLSENLFIVFHTYGSHFNYKERYPEEFATQPANATEVEYKTRTNSSTLTTTVSCTRITSRTA